MTEEVKLGDGARWDRRARGRSRDETTNEV